MLNTTKFGAVSELGAALTATSQQITLPAGQGLRFSPLASGDYFYLTLKNAGQREVVKVTNVQNDVLTVIRGVDNTTAQAFPKGSCVAFEWNPLQLCEYSTQCTNATLPTGVAAGTYCFNCNTCITVNGEGRIISIDGEVEC
jgi:hypothetical protein